MNRETDSGPSPPGNVVSADEPCVHCGYNLRGLNDSGRCPECGSSIALTTRGPWLHLAPAARVRRTAQGVLAICLAVGTGLVCGLLAFLLVALFGRPNWVMPVLFVLATVGWLGGAGLTFFGVMWLARAGAYEPAQNCLSRRMLIHGLWIFPLLVMLLLLSPSPAPGMPGYLGRHAVRLVMLTAALAFLLALLAYLRWLAISIPRHGIARAYLAGIFLALFMGALAIFQQLWWSMVAQPAAWAAAQQNPLRSPPRFYIVVSDVLERVCAIGWLALLLAGVPLLILTYARIRSAARIAQRRSRQPDSLETARRLADTGVADPAGGG